jgi:hypothetical protein
MRTNLSGNVIEEELQVIQEELVKDHEEVKLDPTE